MTTEREQRLVSLRQEMQPLDIAIGRLRQELAERRWHQEAGQGAGPASGGALRPPLRRMRHRLDQLLTSRHQQGRRFSELAARRMSIDSLDEFVATPAIDPQETLHATELAVEQKRATVALLRGELARLENGQATDAPLEEVSADQLVRRGAVIPTGSMVARLVGRVRVLTPADLERVQAGAGQRPKVTVAIRFHDISDLRSLERCLAALQAQDGVELTVLVVFQGSARPDLDAVQEVIERVWLIAPVPRLVSVPNPEGADIRSALLNRALDIHYQETSNDFFYVFDHDDLVFSHALAAMAAPVVGSEAAVSFGKVLVARYVSLDGYDFLYRMEDHFKALVRDITELALDNFFPIHGYVYHTRAMPPGRLRFNEGMDRLEDYEALLRVVTAFPVYTDAIDTLVGLYCWKGQRAIDGPIEGASAEEATHWDRNRRQLAETFIEITTPRTGR